MSFQDDLANDLAAVFYDDFKTQALIMGQPVEGHLSHTDSAFGVDAKVYVFDGRAIDLKNVRRGDQLTIAGQVYTVVRPDFFGERIHLTLDI